MNRPIASPADRYTISREIASGGMATVYLGRLLGPGGFSRPVAIKRPHAHVARLPEFRAMLLDEGRLAASISHPNVVSTLDVVADGEDLFLVMEYVPGHTLSEVMRLLRKREELLPPAIASAVLHGVLLGLSAVHDARDERGTPLGIVHRDISPQNILVGRDGVARVLDFGVAKAAGRLQITREGQLKGKIAYMAPEQMRGNVTHRTDIYAASIVLWEALTAKRLFTGSDDVEIFSKALTSVVVPPSRFGRGPGSIDAEGWARLDALVLRGLAREPSERFASAQEMATELALCVPPATPAEVSAWVESVAGDLRPIPEAVESAGSSTVTVADSGAGAHGGTQSGPVPERLAVQISRDEVSAPVLAAPSERPPRRKRRLLSVLTLAAVASCSLLALTFGRRHEPTGQEASVAPAPPASNASPVAASPPPTALDAPPSSAATVGAADASVATAGDATGALPLGSAASRGHDKPAPKNRVEHPRRAPVASETIDVSHAIDARH